MTTLFEIKDFKVKSTGADGGNYYISCTVDYKGNKRNLTVIFKGKIDEKRLTNLNVISVEGTLLDDSSEYFLTLLESEIIQ